jgi:2-polyprenyl-3-methyl-5-hydroxy-6-metoxy-1,4-benzoquinol methylase
MEQLEKIGSWYSSHEGIHGRLLELEWSVLKNRCVGSSCLELGSADGGLTTHLVEHFDRLLSVDGSHEACRKLREKIADRQGFEVRCSLFEDLDLGGERFSTVISDHVLEHLPDPIALLRSAQEWIEPKGRLLVTVPNALSLHRLLGVEMGILESPYDFSDLDRKLDHRRVYDPATLRSDVESAGWRVTEQGGLFIKLFSNAQLEGMLSAGLVGDEQLRGLMALSRKLPQHCSEIYLIAEPN